MATDSTVVPELPPDYYLNNFLQFLRVVKSQYGDLWLPEEHLVIDRFEKLDHAAQCLYVRLLMRKGIFFRADKLHYPEIPCLHAAASSLATAGFLHVNPLWEPESQLQLLQVTELRQWTGLKRKKAQLIEHIVGENRRASIWHRLHRHLTCWAVAHQVLFSRFQLCFFGNNRQNLSEYVLVDIGQVVYEPVTIHPQDKTFQARAVLLGQELLAALTLRWLENIDHNNTTSVKRFSERLKKEVARLPMQSPKLRSAWARLANAVARQLERLNHLSQAYALYQLAVRPPARERQVRILAATGQTQAALDLCQLLASTERCFDERLFAKSFSPRLKKQLGEDCPATVLPVFSSEQCLLPGASGQGSIEWRVAQYLAHENEIAFYTENHLFCGLFGLTLWHEIFMSRPGAFCNPFQRGPVDQFSRDFYHNRHEAIDSRLASITGQANWASSVREIALQKRGTANYWVNWQIWTPQLLDAVVCAFPWSFVCAVIKFMLGDPKALRKGMPDLVAFRYPFCLGEFRLMEVKGPGDVLRPHQVAWLEFLVEQGVNACVLKVDFEGSKP